MVSKLMANGMQWPMKEPPFINKNANSRFPIVMRLKARLCGVKDWGYRHLNLSSLSILPELFMHQSLDAVGASDPGARDVLETKPPSVPYHI
jgi:hypothetical protein